MTGSLWVWDRSEFYPLEQTEMNLEGEMTLLLFILVTDNKKEDEETGG